MSYLTLKTLHITGAILFVGNIGVTRMWKVFADRTRDPKVITFGQRMVTVTDFAVTGAGASLVLVTGLPMAGLSEIPIWKQTWIQWGLGLFVISGVLWAPVLIPIQIRQARLVRGFIEGATIPPQYWRLGRMWMGFGIAATILPLINVYMMVAKPG